MKQKTNERINSSRETAEVLPFPKRQQQHVAAEAQHRQDVVAETFEHSLDEEQMELERMLIQEGIHLSPEEIRELQSAIPDIFEGVSPEFATHLRDANERLTVTQQKIEHLRSQKKYDELAQELSAFLESESTKAEAMTNPATREYMLTYLSNALAVDQIQEELEAQAKAELVSSTIDIVPGVGSLKMLSETAAGKTMSGRELEGGKRVMHGAEAIAFLALDAVALIGLLAAPETFGAGAAVTVGAEGAKAARVLKLGERGLQIGKTITRFGALCRKTTKLRTASKTIYKFGRLLQKYPRLAGAVTRVIEHRRSRKRKEVIAKVVKFPVRKNTTAPGTDRLAA